MTKVISLLQPWAELVVLGAKQIETRSWKTEYRGELLIHASKKIDAESYNLCSKWPFDEYIKSPLTLDRGAIIGKVTLHKIETSETTMEWMRMRESEQAQEEYRFGDYSPERFCWFLSDPVKFAKPIPCGGHLGLWNFEYDESIVHSQQSIVPPIRKHSYYHELAERQHRIQRDLK